MNIGTLTIEIAANIARLQSDMDQTKKIVSSAMKDVETYVGYAKTAFIGLTGVAGVGAFIGMINGSIDAKARLYDLSIQTGINVEALSALAKVAKYSHTSLDEIAGASNKLSKALFTQNDESKGAAQAINALGINFDRFKQLQADQQMLQIAKAMATFKDDTGKSAAAMLLFGKTGATLLPFLKELAEKNELVGRETTESARRAKEYEDNLITLKAAGEEWKRELVNGILPALVSVTSELVDGRKAYGGYLSAMFDIGLNVDPFKSIAQNLGSTRTELEGARAELARLQSLKKEGGIFAAAQAAGVATDIEALTRQISTLEARMKYLKSQQSRDALALGAGVGDDARFRKPSLGLTAPPDKVAVTAVKDEYAALIEKINEKIAAQQLELDGGKRLTAGQEEALRVMERIRSGLSGTTRDENALIGKTLELMLANEKLVDAQREEAKQLEELYQARERLFDTEAAHLQHLLDEAEAAKHQADTYGMTSEALFELETARRRDLAAMKEQKAALADDAGLKDVAETYRRQAKAILEVAAARDVLAAKEAHERNDPTAGAARAFKEYMDDVKRAGDSTYGAVRNAIGGLEDLGTDLLTKGRGDIKSWVTMVISEINRLYVVRPLLASIFGNGGANANGMFGSIAGLFGGGGGTTGNNPSAYVAPSGGMGGFFNSVGSFFAGMFADGGYIPPGRWGIAGEKGPEPVFGGRTGVTVQASAPAAAATRVVHVGGIHISVPPNTSRATADQIAAKTGAALQRAMRIA